jgi:hypothetical protein
MLTTRPVDHLIYVEILTLSCFAENAVSIPDVSRTTSPSEAR